MKAIGIGSLLLAGFLAFGGTLTGSWTFTTQWALTPFSITDLDTIVTLGYKANGTTTRATALADLSGLQNVFFDLSGTMGPFALRSIIDFNAATPRFRTWLVSGATAIAGANFYALWMLDDVNPSGSPAIGSGLTLGGWATNGSLSLWVEARSNMVETLTYVYRYGYRWLLDHFIFQQCDIWYKPSGYIDVQTSGTTLTFSGLSVYMETPFVCGKLLTQLSFSKAGFEQILFELTDLDLGLEWVKIKWVDVMFTTTNKTVNIVFDAPLILDACLTTYFALEGPLTGLGIEGIGLKALTVACTWNGVTLKLGHMFDENGWYPYLNYLGTRVYGWTWDGELATVPACAVTEGYDEFIGIKVDGAACCGGSYVFSAFAWFDTGNSSGIFDWVESRFNLQVGLGSSVDVSFGLSVTTSGVNWVRLGATLRW
jgi:hypothetical protein